MTSTLRSQIIFEALAQVNPAAAEQISSTFNGMPKVAAAVGMAELKRSLGLGRFDTKVRCA